MKPKFPTLLACAAMVASGQIGHLNAAVGLETQNDGKSLAWGVMGDWLNASLKVTGANIAAYERQLASGEAITMPTVDGNNQPLPDGVYKWELTVYAEGQVTRSDEEAALSEQDALSNSAKVESGSFSIKNGVVVLPSAPRKTGIDNDIGMLPRDQQILDDLIVDGSACVGQDCVNGESFGFDTIRLKENNLRIKFQDTSNSASFPSNDWQITINDSSNGGANKFAIDDITGGRTPFTIEASAPSHSLYVDDGGRIGVGTSTPVVEIHNKSGDTPTLRLEQDGTSGFTAQTWDLASNETNFFIRDASNGSTLPFRIRPGAPTSSVDIAANGDLGLGTSSPAAPVHVRRTNGTAKVLIEEASGTTAARTMLELKNNGVPKLVFNHADEGETWSFEATDADTFEVVSSSAGESVWSITSDGDLVISGDLTANGQSYASDANKKNGVVAIEPKDILSKVATMPISEWSYNADGPSVRHIGPMAQDFKATFGLGKSETSISVSDAGGVALAAIQGLNQVVQEKDAEIDALKQKSERMEKQLEFLMKEVEALKQN